MLDFDDRIWPKLLQRVCAESLATIWFEPVADLARGTAVGYRARPRFPLAGADYTNWLEAAERHGYRARFAAATLATILARREDLPANAFLLVELDATALGSDGVASVLRQAGDLSAIVLEVTRFEPDRDHRHLRHALEVARSCGALLSLRGSGAGHADPLALADLSPQFVRVSADLVGGIDAHPRRTAALAALGELASQLDAWLIADGVAREAELDVLRELGVPLAQGPLIGGDRELMMGLEPEARERLRGALDERADRLTALADPVRTVPVKPQLATEVTVVVDADNRPLEVIVPVPGGRTRSHPPLAVQRQDEIRAVALRATSRPSEDQSAPLCLCDELGSVRGVIRIEALLQAVARAA